MNGRIPRILIVSLLVLVAQPPGWARGVSPYLPLNLSPEIERQIERVLILADKSVMSRPIPAAVVLDALPAACRVDEVLCRRVRRYLDRYMQQAGISQASAEIAATDGVATPLPNRRGLLSDSAWQVSAQAYWQPRDHVLLNLGGVAHEDDATPTGSILSLGFDFAQLDIGYRDHWFSPFAHGAMIISTQARTLPSVTLSNYRPISRLGLQYEVFLAEMAHSDRIRFEDGFTAGNPRLAGLRFSIEPAAGWSLGANRMMQFGGGARGGRSVGDFFDALFKPHQNDNRSDTLSQEQEFGNQVAAWTSRFIFPGSIPFTVYLEYAGEDNSYGGDFRLGNAALSMGITFPRLWRRFDLSYETSEWQNGWYVHGIYADGLTEDGRVLGHWGADARAPGDAVGAQSHMLRLGWEPRFGGLMQLRMRTIANESYGSVDYERGYEAGLSYSRTLRGLTAGAEILAGRDVFGDDYGRLAGFVRFGDEWADGGSAAWLDDVSRPRGAELFVDAGVNLSRATIFPGDGSPRHTTSDEVAPHIGLGARRAVSDRSDLGVRVEFDRIDGEALLAVRALDYRYRFRNPLAFSLFIGAARYELATPAYGYYLGAGVQWRDILPQFDLGLDWRYADKVARDKLLASDPAIDPRPDIFYDISGWSLSLSRRF
ncbi:capsule assembly Wzi family protein [Steroidobacter denitrificans]|uniref:capsule assembly Wzi family protein n=1 Tax=Steroidobacter denitrificans TaxID=465721 RepID=UPI001AEFA7B5|nr:capsule assembly Wzi family protein [Steroidobacter denitrificans]